MTEPTNTRVEARHERWIAPDFKTMARLTVKHWTEYPNANAGVAMMGDDSLSLVIEKALREAYEAGMVAMRVRAENRLYKLIDDHPPGQFRRGMLNAVGVLYDIPVDGGQA